MLYLSIGKKWEQTQWDHHQMVVPQWRTYSRVSTNQCYCCSSHENQKDFSFRKLRGPGKQTGPTWSNYLLRARNRWPLGRNGFFSVSQSQQLSLSWFAKGKYVCSARGGWRGVPVFPRLHGDTGSAQQHLTGDINGVNSLTGIGKKGQEIGFPRQEMHLGPSCFRLIPRRISVHWSCVPSREFVY